jgi:hypothetical protein
MKALSGTFAFKLALLAVIAIVVVLTFRAFAQPQPADGKKFTLKIGRSDTEFVDVRSKGGFINKLKQLKEDQYQIDFKDHDGAPVEHYPPLPRVSIKTDKITTSEVARTEPAEESSAYDPNVVHRVQSNSATEIKSVLDEFKE